MAEPSPARREDRRSLVFRLGSDRFEMDAARVVEIVRAPAITRGPDAPRALAGIANLRGAALPVVSLAALLGLPMHSAGAAAKIVVIDRGERIGFIVDDVVRLGAMAQGQALLDPDADGRLDAVFRFDRPQPARAARTIAAGEPRAADEPLNLILSFYIGAQVFALPLDHVREVLSAQDATRSAAGAGGDVLGLMSLRDSVLPIMSLALLLGLAQSDTTGTGARIIVVDYRGTAIGLAVDRIDTIRRLPESAIDPVPMILRRGHGPAEIDAIARADGGRMLISILSAERLFGLSAVDQAVRGNGGATRMSTPKSAPVAQEKILIFTLGEETYGLPIVAVDEVIRVPDAVTRLPNAPPFVIGAIDLRGKPIPLIDQRQRFGVAGSRPAQARAVIVTAGGLTAGFIVDGITEVMTRPASDFAPAPAFATERTAVFDRVTQGAQDGRMILLLDPRELLSRAERDLIAALAPAEPVAGSTGST